MAKKNEINRFNDYKWEGIPLIDYKPSGDSMETFFNVKRQNLFCSDEQTQFDVRYFECGQDGFTTLEKHEHAHIVMVLRGTGLVIIGDKVEAVKAFDFFEIPSNMPHQLINTAKEPFGFVCSVNAVRDKFKLLSKAELEALKNNASVGKAMRVPVDY